MHPSAQNWGAVPVGENPLTVSEINAQEASRILFFSLDSRIKHNKLQKKKFLTWITYDACTCMYIRERKKIHTHLMHIAHQTVRKIYMD